MDRSPAPVRAAVAATVIGFLPVQLTGAVSPLLRTDLDLPLDRLGVVVATSALAAAVASPPAGWLVERIGAAGALRAGALGSAIALAAVALADSGTALLVGLVLGGLANALAQPAVNLTLARQVRPAVRATAFGAKQAAVPLCSVIAGVALPVVALRAGWRTAFAVAAVAAAAVAAAGTRRSGGTVRVARSTAGPRAGHALLLALTICGMVALAAGSGSTVYYVESMVARGMATPLAGAGLAFGGGVAACCRLAAGALLDAGAGLRRPLAGVAWMLVAGAGGCGLLAVTGAVPLLAVGTALALGVGWGWSGLYLHAVAAMYDDTPAAATAWVQGGFFASGVLGPVAFGLVLDRLSATAAWAGAGGALAIGAAMAWALSSCAPTPSGPEGASDLLEGVVVRGGVEPPTFRFSAGRSTN